MNISVKKPNAEEAAEMRLCPIWSCGVSEFDWSYESEETCLIMEGEAAVEYDGGSASLGAGDYVVFPKGLTCVWNVRKPIKKYYRFR